MTTDADACDPVRLRAPALLIGVGLGGFVDGIVLHQIFQAHHMLSSAGDDRLGLTPRPVTTVDGLRVNTLWDGLFHLSAYLFVLAGLFWLWQRWRSTVTERAPWSLLVGGLLAGWGVFNLVEGVVNHHVLAIHHVYDNDLQWLWDLSFLALGVALLGAGLRLTREPDAPTRYTHRPAGVFASGTHDELDRAITTVERTP